MGITWLAKPNPARQSITALLYPFSISNTGYNNNLFLYIKLYYINDLIIFNLFP